MKIYKFHILVYHLWKSDYGTHQTSGILSQKKNYFHKRMQFDCCYSPRDTKRHGQFYSIYIIDDCFLLYDIQSRISNLHLGVKLILQQFAFVHTCILFSEEDFLKTIKSLLSQVSTRFKHMTSRYRCSALPTELSSQQEAGHFLNS